MEIWASAAASPRGIRHVAAYLEEAGWDGLVVVDSQNLSGDSYVALAVAATVTQNIGLATGVTNSITRQAAVTAGAIASIQRLSKGRATLGIGRGDSALAHLGRAPAKLAQFERYIRHLQTYLAGGAVPFDEIDIPLDAAPTVAELNLADTPAESRIAWAAGAQKVPVEVAATGPKVIAVAARHADRVMLTLGAEPERIAWGIEEARAARLKAGLDPDGITIGAYINCSCHPDIEIARDLVSGGLTTFARFSVMHGKTAGPLREGQADVLENLRSEYDMHKHTQRGSRQAETLTPDFIDRFAIVGPPEVCIARFEELRALGLDKIVIGGFARESDEGDSGVAKTLMEREVLPAIRGAT